MFLFNFEGGEKCGGGSGFVTLSEWQAMAKCGEYIIVIFYIALVFKQVIIF